MLTCTLARAHQNAHRVASAILGGFSLMAVDIIKPEWSTPKKVTVAILISLVPGTVRELSGSDFNWRDMGNNVLGTTVFTPTLATFTIRW